MTAVSLAPRRDQACWLTRLWHRCVALATAQVTQQRV